MCGRYRLHKRDARQLEAEYGISAEDVTPAMVLDRSNIKPTQELLAVLAEGEARRPAIVKWGVKLPQRQLINARDDKVFESRLWKPMFEHGRVLLPASGFYEWSGPKGARQPHLLETDEPFALGGVMRATNEGIEAVIVTTTPNEVVEPIHDRMPVMLAQDDFDGWLLGDPDEAAELLRPWPRQLRDTPLEVGAI